MKIIQYKNNRYIVYNDDLYIVAQAEPCPTIGSLVKVTSQTFAEKVLAEGTPMEGLLSDGKLKEFED
jgi:hypothetical protein